MNRRSNKNTISIMDKVRNEISRLANTVFPTDIYCICCGSIIDSSRIYSICDSCIRKFQWITGCTCQKCGKPLSEEDPHKTCYDCRTIHHYFDKGYTCCLYDLYARAVVMDMKYRDKSYICRIIGDILADRMMLEFENSGIENHAQYDFDNGGDCFYYTLNSGDIPAPFDEDKYEANIENSIKEKSYDLTVPVPVSKKRMDERGYNQAALIAKRFSEKIKILFAEDILARSDKTIPMKDLDAMQRRLNVKGAFRVTKGGEQRIKSKRILLIDDIYTTGATVDECAFILKKSGASVVDILTFAAGRNYVPKK